MLGLPCPRGRDGNGSLLLAKGHVLADERAVKALLERGVFIDAAEARGGGQSPRSGSG